MNEKLTYDIDYINAILKDEKKYINIFFRNKGEWNDEMLFSQRYLDMVFDLDINDINLIYEAINLQHEEIDLKKIERNGHLPDDVKLVIVLLKECAKLRIPRFFAVGIIAMYLELCKNFKINY